MAGDRHVLGPAPQHDPLRWWVDNAVGAARSEPAVTLELRWFGRGDPPAAIDAITAGVRVGSCVDRYARCGRDDLSLKLRGDRRLTVKQRRCSLAVLAGLPPAERWSRRTATTPGRWAVEGPSWVTVRKRRARLLVDLTGPDTIVVHAPRRQVARGGGLELVHLEPEGRPALWSIACEAWGPGDRDGMARLLAWTGVDWEAVDRSADLSASYPAALTRLIEPERVGPPPAQRRHDGAQG